MPVWLARRPALCFVSCVFSYIYIYIYIFFFFFCQLQQGTAATVQWIVAAFFLLFHPFITSVGPVHCLWDPQISLFSNFFIKNGSHDTIHTFKNYFATVFSVSVFSFSNNIGSIQTDPRSFTSYFSCSFFYFNRQLGFAY